MPHIHLITSANLVENVEADDLLCRLVETLSRQESIDPSSIKAYHSMMSAWAMGKGAPAGFAHCRLELMTGRPIELRRRIADAMFEAMRLGFAASAAHSEVSLTFELREMDRETYRKG